MVVGSAETFSVAYVAQMLHVTQETVRRWIRSGKLVPLPPEDPNKPGPVQFSEAQILWLLGLGAGEEGNHEHTSVGEGR